MNWRRFAQAARWLVAVPLALELLYLLVGNAVLFSGVIQRAASAAPQETQLGWDRAYTLWPGRAYVSGFRLRLQDPVIQFRLTIDRAKVDVVLWELLHRRFRASHVRAEGVSYRMLTKVDGTTGREARVAAFPPLEGFARPALLHYPPPPYPSPKELAGLWSVRLDDVEATVDELWFLEYRYHGPAHVWGAFALAPLQRLWVGPALLLLQGGQLDVGEHVVSRAVTARAEVTIAPVDLTSSPGPRVVRALTASMRLDAGLDDLGAAGLYQSGLDVRASGKVSAELRVEDGRLRPGTAIELWLPAADAQLAGYRFTGDCHATLGVLGPAEVPIAGATARGVLLVPLFEKKAPLVAALSGLSGELAFADNDLSQGLSLGRLHAVLGEARVRDAQLVTQTVGAVVPLIAPAVLGDGPLVASATAHVTPEYTLVRLGQLKLGASLLEGAAVTGPHGWNGAAAGRFGLIPIGFRLRGGKLETVPFVGTGWLDAELKRAGIRVVPPLTVDAALEADTLAEPAIDGCPTPSIGGCRPQ